eukprot:750897-Hanusia_phi.AAC.1
MSFYLRPLPTPLNIAPAPCLLASPPLFLCSRDVVSLPRLLPSLPLISSSSRLFLFRSLSYSLLSSLTAQILVDLPHHRLSRSMAVLFHRLQLCPMSGTFTSRPSPPGISSHLTSPPSPLSLSLSLPALSLLFARPAFSDSPSIFPLSSRRTFLRAAVPLTPYHRYPTP